MIAYKLFKLRKDGTIGPLFIDRTLRVPFNKWMMAEDHPTKGFAHRPGWHLGKTPEAPHLTTKGRVWCECEIDTAYGFYTFTRPSNQGGAWIIAKRIKVLRIMRELML